MTFQAATGIAEVVCGQVLRGQEVLNIVHYEHDDGVWTPANLATLVDNIKTKWRATGLGIGASQSNEILIGRFTARDLTSEAGAEVISTVADGTGQSGDGALESSLAAVVTLGTGVAGRSYRGRVYLGGLASTGSSFSDPNHLTGAAAAALATRASYTFTNGLMAAAQHVVLSRINGGIVRTVGIGTTISSYTVNTRLDNQRRRLPRN